ncbi:MAG: DUF2147 domain-containing protein [Rhizobiaceae bacterium]|nr:DUF2147 domain-containing protein [Rhizobiaceae bacterium]
MNYSLRALPAAAALAIIVAGTTTSHADEPIVGNWKTESGETAAIGSCGGAYCITLRTGKYAGKRIGRLKGAGDSYSGTITDPSDQKQYSGSAKVVKKSMKLRGCALKIFCRTQSWRKL